ncbi:hypothetical protein [Kitasatospora sp. NPDC057500]
MLTAEPAAEALADHACAADHVRTVDHVLADHALSSRTAAGNARRLYAL